jgi:hypothetical protein
MVSFDHLLGAASMYKFVDQTTVLTSNQAVGFTGSVIDGTKDIRILLVWTDAYKTTTGGTMHAALVNNLDLSAYDGIGTQNNWYGNNIDSTTGYSKSNPVPVVYDGVNNVEAIFIPAGFEPTGGSISMFVSSQGLMGDAVTPSGTIPEQDFAIFAYNVH